MNSLAVAEFVCAAFVAVSIISLTKKLKGESDANWLKLSLISVFFYLIVDACCLVFSDSAYPFAFIYVINLLSYCAGGVVVVVTTKYAEAYVRKRTTVGKWMFLVPVILFMIVIGVNIFLFVTGQLVVFENGVITKVNDYPLWLRQIQIIALLIVPCVALFKYKKLGARVTGLIVLYYLMPIIAVALGAFFRSDFTIVLGSISIVSVSLFTLRDRLIETESEKVVSDKLRENITRFFALEDNFESLYDIDMTDGYYEEFAKGEFYRNIVSDRLVPPTDFFEDVHTNIDSIIDPEDREGLHKLLTRETIRDELAKQDYYDYFYRILSENGSVWFKMRLVYKDAEKKNVIIGVFLAVNDIETKQLVQQQIRYDTIHDIIHSGKWSFFINADDEITRKEDSEVVQKIIDYDLSDDFLAWVDIVHPDDREAALEAFNATIKDHTCATPYDVTYRMIDRKGEYHWYHSAGRIIRDDKGEGEFFGIHIDITTQMEEQKKRLLGTLPLSSDILAKSEIGMWAFELDEDKPPRMYVDETMLKLIGLDHQLSPEETYKAWHAQIDEESLDLVADAVESMKNGEQTEVQYPWHHPNGHTVVVRCGGIRNPEYTDGIRIEGTHQNVTSIIHFDEEERKRAKRLKSELALSQLRADVLAYLADNDPDLNNAFNFFGERMLEISHSDLLVFRDTDGNTIFFNAPDAENIPANMCDGCPYSDIGAIDFGNEDVIVMEDTCKGCNGMKPNPGCPAKSSIMLRVYVGGELAGVFSVHYYSDTHSISENSIDNMRTAGTYFGLLLGRINHKKSEKARIQAELSNKAKTEFLFHMSHDIRTPMNAIIGYTNKALKYQSDPKVLSDSLETVKSSSDYLLKIINDILDMARIESGKLELKETLHHGGDGKSDLLDMFGEEAERKGIKLNSKYDVKDHYIWFDENRAHQIAVNFISNAIKYTDAGGEVTYSLEQFPSDKPGYGKYVMSVKDTGCGMSPEFLSKVFEPFERSQSAISGGIAGTGLGMAIVKRLADALGGTIDIESELGVGTKVAFTADFRIATPEEIEAYETAREDFVVADMSHLKGKRVLLVEDNALNRNLATDILEDGGMVVECAEDGSVALQYINRNGIDYYDVILMDIQMPVMNGYEATRAIRELYPESDLPIIALSANAFDEDREESKMAGMNDHVAKPIDSETLFGIIGKYI